MLVLKYSIAQLNIAETASKIFNNEGSKKIESGDFIKFYQQHFVVGIINPTLAYCSLMC